MQGGCAGICRDDVIFRHAKVGCEIALEALHFGPHAEIAVFADHTADGISLGLSHNGTGKSHGHCILHLHNHEILPDSQPAASTSEEAPALRSVAVWRRKTGLTSGRGSR